MFTRNFHNFKRDQIHKLIDTILIDNSFRRISNEEKISFIFLACTLLLALPNDMNTTEEKEPPSPIGNIIGKI